MNQRWNPTLDNRTRGEFVGVKPFFTEIDTKVPMREAIEPTWLDRLLKRQRMQTVWVNKRFVRMNAMMRRTINCRCAMVEMEPQLTTDEEFPPERPNLITGPVTASLKCTTCNTIMSKFWAEDLSNNNKMCFNPLCETNRCSNTKSKK